MDMWESVVHMLSALGIVLALILGLLAIARSAIGRRFLPLTGTPLVRILADSPIGSRKHVLLIAVAGEVLILGTTPTDVVPLGKITDPERLKHLLVDPMASPRSSSGAAVYSDDSQKGHRAS